MSEGMGVLKGLKKELLAASRRREVFFECVNINHEECVASKYKLTVVLSSWNGNTKFKV